MGKLDATDAARLTTGFTAAAARSPRIIADLGALEYIDCCALGVLTQMRAQARAAGGDLLLAAPHGLVGASGCWPSRCSGVRGW